MEIAKKMVSKELGVAVVGSGRMGTLRASMAAAHPSVSFIAVSDLDLGRARALAERVGGQFYSDNNLDVISRPEVNAVIVCTPENEHTLPVLQALEQEKPVLVETPMATNLADAGRLVNTAAGREVEFRIGYEMRFKRQYQLAKEQIVQGRMGKILGGTGRLYNTRAQAFQILKRSPNITHVVDVLTYYVDLFCWFLEGNSPVEIVARGQWGVFKAAGYDVFDITWAIVTFADGAVVNLGIDYALPEKYPTLGQSPRIEVLGTEGVMLFDEDHKDQIFYSDRGIPHGYVPDHSVNMAFLSTTSAGDWAQGNFWGPLADETRAWLDHLSKNHPCVLATPEEALRNLEVTLAIDRSAQSEKVVRLPLVEGG